MKNLLLIIISFVLIPMHAQEPLENVKQFLEKYSESSGVLGFSVVLVDKDKTIFQAAYGTTKAKGTVPMTATTTTSIGSVTKSFTALAILQLEESKALNIDDLVIKHLSWFRTADKENSDKITLKMLLSNSSGIPSIDKLIFNTDNSADADEFIVRSLSAHHTSFNPGSAFEYSNEGWVVLGLVIKKITGLSYPVYIERNILSPLKMFRSTSEIEKSKLLGALMGHFSDAEGMHPAESVPLSYGYAAAGSILASTAEDMGHYISMLLNKGTYAGSRVISEQSWNKLFTPIISYPGMQKYDGGEGLYDSYGLGWMISPVLGQEIRHHGGNTGTMSSYLVMDPKRQIGAMVLCNSPPAEQFKYVNMMNAVLNILRLYSGQAETDYALPRTPDPYINEFDLDRAGKEKYIGTYSSKSDAGTKIQVRIDGKGRLVCEFYRGGVLGNSAVIDLLTPASAILRSGGMSMGASFILQGSNYVNGMITMGDTFYRDVGLTPDVKEFGIMEKDGFVFAMPAGWTFSGKESGSSVLVGPNSSISILMATSADTIFDSVEKWAGQKIMLTGTEHRETVGTYGWIERSYITPSFGLTAFYTQTVSGGWLVIVKTTCDDLTRAVAEDLRPLITSIKFR